MLSLPVGLSEFYSLLEQPRPHFAPGKVPYSEMQQQSAVLFWAHTASVHLREVSERAWLRINAVVITLSLESLEWLQEKKSFSETPASLELALKIDISQKNKNLYKRDGLLARRLRAQWISFCSNLHSCVPSLNSKLYFNYL